MTFRKNGTEKRPQVTLVEGVYIDGAFFNDQIMFSLHR